jgi:hypothetical protein
MATNPRRTRRVLRDRVVPDEVSTHAVRRFGGRSRDRGSRARAVPLGVSSHRSPPRRDGGRSPCAARC